jgi:hypothetical protein
MSSYFLHFNIKWNSSSIHEPLQKFMCRWYGFNDIWISQDVVDEDKFVCEFKQRFIDCFVSEAVAFFEDSPKCNFYRYI